MSCRYPSIFYVQCSFTTLHSNISLSLSLSLCSSLHPQQQAAPLWAKFWTSFLPVQREFFPFHCYQVLPHMIVGVFSSTIVGIFSPWYKAWRLVDIEFYLYHKSPKTERERRMDKTLTWPADCVSEHWCIFPEWAATCWCFLLLSDALLCCESSHNAQSQPGHTDTTWRHKQHRAGEA